MKKKEVIRELRDDLERALEAENASSLELSALCEEYNAFRAEVQGWVNAWMEYNAEYAHTRVGNAHSQQCLDISLTLKARAEVRAEVAETMQAVLDRYADAPYGLPAIYLTTELRALLSAAAADCSESVCLAAQDWASSPQASSFRGPDADL